MRLQTFSKLFFVSIMCTTLASCVNNKDQDTTGTIIDPINLTPETLAGKWEVYFFNKTIIPTATNIQSKYRNTEYDGFTVTFAANGTYYENNIFGHETKSGIYKLGNYTEDPETVLEGTGSNPSLKKDGVFMKFKTTITKKDTLIKAELPAMFSDHFAFRDRYGGDAQGKGYRLEDIRYFRNMETAPNYLPTEKEFKKNILNVNDILGRWEFYDYYIRIDHILYPAPSDVVKYYGEQYLFKLENGKQKFSLFKKGMSDTPYKTGEFKIIDDVVNIFTKETTNGVEKIESFKLWVKEPLGTTDSKKMIKSYDKYRDVKDVLKEKEEFDFFRKIGDN